MRGCFCCAAWARHFKAAGFGTVVHELDDLAPIRAEMGVPEDLGGCHTAKVAGYVVEGHVPLAAVQRLLTERPAIIGLALPGMPMNSPGMEIEGEKDEPFDVIAFAADGRRTVLMEVRPSGRRASRAYGVTVSGMTIPDASWAGGQPGWQLPWSAAQPHDPAAMVDAGYDAVLLTNTIARAHAASPRHSASRRYRPSPCACSLRSEPWRTRREPQTMSF